MRILKVTVLLLILICSFGCGKENKKSDQDNSYNLSKSELEQRDFIIKKLEDEESISFTKQIFGMKIPEIELKNLIGKEIDYTDLSKKRYIIEYASTTCTGCQETQPYIDAYKQRNTVPIIQIFGSPDTIQTIEPFLNSSEKNDLEYTFLDKSGFYFNKMGIKYTPTFIFVDKGIARLGVIGSITDEMMSVYYSLAFNK